MTDIQLIITEIRHTFLLKDCGAEKEFAELSFFNDGSMYFKMIRRIPSRDEVLHSESFHSFAAFRNSPLYPENGINQKIIDVLMANKKVHVLTNEGIVTFRDCCRGTHGS